MRKNDARLAKRFFEEVRAGTAWINDPLTDNYGGSFGGMKMSGNARELGEEGLENFLETKHVHWDFDDTPKRVLVSVRTRIIRLRALHRATDGVVGPIRCPIAESRCAGD